jgi:type II secretory pathway component GspD/PulD (secretin)
MVFTQTATPQSSTGQSSTGRSATGQSSTGLSSTGGPPAAADLPAAIAALKQQKKAVILAH